MITEELEPDSAWKCTLIRTRGNKQKLEVRNFCLDKNTWFIFLICEIGQVLQQVAWGGCGASIFCGCSSLGWTWLQAD